MDAEILLIFMTLMICGFFIALIRVVLRCAEEAEIIQPQEEIDTKLYEAV